MVLSPGQILEAGVRLAPDMSDGNLRDDFRTFAEDQIRASGSSRPGRVSERGGEKTHTHLLTLI